MKRTLRYLGFLGFLGLLGLWTGNAAFYAFFNFFGFWGLANFLAKQRRDELLVANAARAGLNAFAVSSIGISLTIAVLSVFKTLEAVTIAIIILFTAQLLTFILSFGFYEKRGS
jgi:hypothetical protein